MIAWLKRLFAPPEFPRPMPMPESTAQPRRKGISDAALKLAGAAPQKKHEFKAPDLPPGVVPDEIKSDPKKLVTDAVPQPYMALDDGSQMPFYAYANVFNTGLGFPGYPYLAEKTRISEFRSPSITLATEMTRKWIKFRTEKKGDFVDEIAQIKTSFEDFGIRNAFRRAAMQDGFFGRSQIYPRVKDQLDDETRKLPLIPEAIKKGTLLGFQVIEPYWTPPYWYNSIDPTDPDFYKPKWWFVMGKMTHDSRLLLFRSNELPDLFKPAYNFSGMSMTQLMEIDVAQWLRARNAVSDVIYNFSTTVLKTNMEATLAGDEDNDLFRRLELFNKTKSNQSTMVVDKDSEELEKVQTSLSGLDELQAQAQEHMAAPCHIPLVKLFGITPSGLNASSEEEIVVWYDWVRAMQENLFKDPLNVVLKMVQMHLFGKIHDEIGFEFVDLYELDGEALARVRKSDGEAATQYIQSGVLTPEEERERLAADPNSGYNSLVASDVPEPPPSMQPENFENNDDSQAA